MKTKEWTLKGLLGAYGLAQRQADKRLTAIYDHLGLNRDDEETSLLRDAVGVLATATVAGFPSRAMPTVELPVKSAWPNAPIMTESLYRSMIGGRSDWKDGLALSHSDFRGLSVRERGTRWDEVDTVLDQLIAAGYKIYEIRIKSEDGFTERTWDYPATIKIGV